MTYIPSSLTRQLAPTWRDRVSAAIAANPFLSALLIPLYAIAFVAWAL